MDSASAPASIFAYCLASISLTLANKFIVSGHGFTLFFLLLTVQSLVSVALVLVLRQVRVLHFRHFSLQDARAWAPISLLLAAVIYTGSKSLQWLTIPVYTIFKNLAIIVIAYGEVWLFNARITRLALLSFILMVLSSVIAAYSDLTSFSLDNLQFRGYAWMALNVCSSAAYVLTMRSRIKLTGFSDWDSMYYNNLLTIPVLGICSLLTEDLSRPSLLVNFPPETRHVMLPAIVFSGAAAVGISFSTAWCIRVTSSTTYSMVGALNKLPVALSGIMLEYARSTDFKVTPSSVISILVGFLAGLLYALAKNNEKKKAAAEAQTSELPLTNTSRKN